MTEKELAKQMAETAEMSFNNIVPDYKGAIMDYQGYFGNGKYDLRRFAEECEKLGVNSSMIHVDFMIGSKDMSIVGITKDGKRIQIFKDGNWAI